MAGGGGRRGEEGGGGVRREPVGVEGLCPPPLCSADRFLVSRSLLLIQTRVAVITLQGKTKTK